MNQTLKDIIWTVAAVAAGLIIGILIIFIKVSQNSKSASEYTPPEVVEAMAETEALEADKAAETDGGDVAVADDEFVPNTQTPYTGPVFDDDDLIFLLGQDFSKAQTRFGASEQVVSEGNQYFQDACVSVSYDSASKQILLVESDNKGKEAVKLCNFSVGMSREEVYTVIYERMTEGDMYDDYATLSYVDVINEVPFEAEVVFANDSVSKVTCRLNEDNDEGNGGASEADSDAAAEESDNE